MRTVKLKDIKYSYTKDGYLRLTATVLDKWKYEKMILHDHPMMGVDAMNELLATVLKEAEDYSQ